MRIHKVGRHRTHLAWRAHNTAFAYSQTWRVRWCMRTCMRKRKVWLNLRICNWMVAHAQLDQCCWWLTKGDRNGQNSLQGDKNVERLLARAMYRTPCDVPATESDAHLTCCTPAKRDDVLVRRRCPSLCICIGYSCASWKRILNPGFQDGSRRAPNCVSGARHCCIIKLIQLPFQICDRLCPGVHSRR